MDQEALEAKALELRNTVIWKEPVFFLYGEEKTKWMSAAREAIK